MKPAYVSVKAEGSGCFSVNYSVSNIGYSSVCGRITAYQVGSTNAFQQYYITKVQLPSTPSMWMVLVSLMETQESTSGHLQLLLDRNDYVMYGRSGHCPCRFEDNPFDPAHRLWERITSVMLAMKSS